MGDGLPEMICETWRMVRS